jgi:type IV secretory pathway TrbL component
MEVLLGNQLRVRFLREMAFMFANQTLKAFLVSIIFWLVMLTAIVLILTSCDMIFY